MVGEPNNPSENIDAPESRAATLSRPTLKRPDRPDRDELVRPKGQARPIEQRYLLQSELTLIWEQSAESWKLGACGGKCKGRGCRFLPRSGIAAFRVCISGIGGATECPSSYPGGSFFKSCPGYPPSQQYVSYPNSCLPGSTLPPKRSD